MEVNNEESLLPLIKEALTRLSGGKRIGSDAYFHISYSGIGQILDSLLKVNLRSGTNVVRFGVRQSKLTLSELSYKNFFDDPFPELEWSVHLVLSDRKSTTRIEGKNPAILHRKELLINDAHPRRADYVHLTDELVAHKLLPASAFVGRRNHWTQYLEARGFHVTDGKLVALVTK